MGTAYDSVPNFPVLERNRRFPTWRGIWGLETIDRDQMGVKISLFLISKTGVFLGHKIKEDKT